MEGVAEDMMLLLAILLCAAVVAVLWIVYPMLVAMLGQGVAAGPDTQVWSVLAVLFTILAVGVLITWMAARRRGGPDKL